MTLRTCEGLGPLPDRLVLSRSLGAIHLAALARLAPDEHVLFAPNLAFSDAAFSRVLREGRASGDARLVLDAETLRSIAGLTAEQAVFTYLRGEVTAERVAALPERIVPVPETELPGFNLPDGPMRVVDEWALPVGHWAQLLWANLLGLGPALWSQLGAGVGGALRLAWGAARAGSLAPHLVAAHVNSLGTRAQVHPHATVEGSVLGAGAWVGAGAVVRGCVLGEGARVEDLALVEGSVLGPRACVQRMSMVKYCLLEAGAHAAGTQQLAVLGAGAQVKHGAILMDQSFGDGVRVRVGDGLQRAPHGMLGVCVGPGAVIGSGVRVAAGRAIPAGLTVVCDPASVVAKVTVPEGTRMARAMDGGLQPL